MSAQISQLNQGMSLSEELMILGYILHKQASGSNFMAR